ncbi:hypothetical protein LCGC14_0312920 [marine sediment metagenome]|uniref:Uncharacterized protein n=1 Tax=marine sediment metagenome TaxID=412755 RepID=A0A0F9TLJ7_9ZZZZ
MNDLLQKPRPPTREPYLPSDDPVCRLDGEPLSAHERCEYSVLVGPQHETRTAPCLTCAYYTATGGE